MKEFLSKISNGVKDNQNDIILLIGVILISLLSFAMGYIMARQQEKEPIRIEMYENSNHWSRNMWVVSIMETL